MQPPWFGPLAAPLAPHAQLRFVAEATDNPSLPKALRHMRAAGLTIDNSCFLYPVFELPLRELLAELVSRDLATSTQSLLAPAEAAAWAQGLCQQVDPESTWLSNARWGRHAEGYWYPTGGWKPFTEHTFDAGFVWLAPGSVGFVWAWAED